VGMLKGVLNHLLYDIIEDEVGFLLANVVGQAIMFLHAKKIKFIRQSIKELKFESYILNLPRTYAPRHPDRSPDRCTTSTPSGSMSV
jgi:hypothetical protein